jgi:hypothetical protein
MKLAQTESGGQTMKLYVLEINSAGKLCEFQPSAFLLTEHRKSHQVREMVARKSA